MTEKDLLSKSSISSFLHKKSHSDVKKIWQKRFFVLKDDVLLYFKSNSDFYHPLGILYLYSGSVNRNPIYKKRDYTFVLNCQGRRYHFAADNEKHMSDWCDGLENSIKKANKNFFQEMSEIQTEGQESRMKIVSISKYLEISEKPFVEMVGMMKELMNTLEVFNNSKTISKIRSFTQYEKYEDFKFGDTSSGELFKSANEKILKIREQTTKYSNLLQDSSKNYKYVKDTRFRTDIKSSQIQQLKQKLEQDRLLRLDFIDVFVGYEEEIMSLFHEGQSYMRKYQSLPVEVKEASNDENNEEIGKIKERIAKNEEEIKELNYHKKILLKELKTLREGK